MDSSDESESPIKQKKRYKVFLDPQYREDWTSTQTHAAWMKRASGINIAKNPSKYKQCYYNLYEGLYNFFI